MGREERLPDDSLVVRCGKPPYDVPKPLHERCDEHEGYFGFSVQSAPGATIEELAAWCPNNKIGWTTVGAIRSAGYEVVTTSGEGYHSTVVVPRDWVMKAARTLLVLFEEMTNPIPKESRLR